MLKKIFTVAHLVLILLALSVTLVGFLIFKEVSRTPEEAFQLAQTAETAGQLRKAEKYYLKAAQSQIVPLAGKAYYQLAHIYKTGADDLPKNYQKVADYLAKAGEKNIIPAQYELALLYDVGDKIPEDRPMAIRWMNQASDAGYPDAQYAKAIWMQRGYYGQPDMDEIVRLLQAAANKNHLNAMKSLIVIYTDGYGTFPQNIKMAQELTQTLKNMIKK